MSVTAHLPVALTSSSLLPIAYYCVRPRVPIRVLDDLAAAAQQHSGAAVARPHHSTYLVELRESTKLYPEAHEHRRRAGSCLRSSRCQSVAASAAAHATGSITAATAQMTTAVGTAAAAGTTVTGVTAVGIECDIRMVLASMIGAVSAYLRQSGIQSSTHPMHSAVTIRPAIRGTIEVDDVTCVMMSGAWQAATISMSPGQTCQQAAVMATQQDTSMERRCWMPWCPRSHLAPAQPQQMAGTRRAGLDQVGKSCVPMSMP